ncbi:MAG: hypothetical protein ABEN55_03775 [Bradymonadaceae bacterium]
MAMSELVERMDEGDTPNDEEVWEYRRAILGFNARAIRSELHDLLLQLKVRARDLIDERMDQQKEIAERIEQDTPDPWQTEVNSKGEITLWKGNLCWGVGDDEPYQ